MKPRTFADFMFTGVAIIPALCAWAGEIGYALFAFVALLIVACLFGWREQVDASSDASAREPSDSRDKHHRS